MSKTIYFIVFSIALVAACTSEVKDVPPPEVFLKMPEGGFDLDVDSTLIIEPKITYDVGSTYTWSEEGNVFGDEKNYEFKRDDLKSYNLLFNVKTSYGSDEMAIPVHVLHMNMFEENEKDLNDKGYFNTPAENTYTYKGYIKYPVSQDAAAPENWSGFAISKNTKPTVAVTKDEYSVFHKSGADESKIFAVFKQSETIDHRITFNDGKAHDLKSISINNSTYTYSSIAGAFSKKEAKDFVLLTITGYDATGVETGQVPFYLSDYRPALTADKYIISEWNELDLTVLGSVHAIGFKITSSIDGDPNFTLPKYVCLDNLKIKS